tara:strand:+ start:2986 stop:5229 length:2244 start_codon:yes stop_codon:yes gene_type:complete
MFKIFKNTVVVLFFLQTVCLADVISNINVTGNKRISKESIIVFSNVNLDQDYSKKDLNIILKNLYSTNFFEEINLTIKKNTLNINVNENPIIENIKIEGVKNKKLSEFIVENLKLKSRSSYVESYFSKDLDLLINILKQTGYYFSKVTSSIDKNLVQNSIIITYKIELGDKAKINEIVFIGDKKVKSRKLINVIASEEHKFWKFLSKKAYIDKQRINLDSRLLKNYYRNNGFYNVQINQSFVELKEDNTFKLIFNIDSGPKFTFNKVNLIIPNDYEPTHFKSINKVLSKLEKENYSLNKVNTILKEIDKIALSKQYEFINAKLSESIIDKNKLNITIKLVDTEKTYVEKINIYGNQFTLEEVIRNAFIIDEGDAYNEILFNKSINHIKSKNIFKKVEKNIKDGSNKNLKIIDITVEEKPTGEISLGAGFGSTGGTIGGGIKENNFLGRGISLDTSLELKADSIKGQFIYAKPNFAYTDNTLYTSIESTRDDKMKVYGYKTSGLGFALSTKFEQYENLFFRPEISTNLEKLETNSTASSVLQKQNGDYFDANFNYSLDYDLRNKRYQPSDGYRTTFSQDLPIISDTYEIINSLSISKYKSLVSDMIGELSFYAKSVNTISGKDVRVSKRANIPSSKLRGFESGKVGPKSNNDYIGGNYVTAFNLSTTLPQILPSLEYTDVSLFMDAANVWGVDHSNTVKEHSAIRSSVGVGVKFMSPIGPLNFSLAQPITKSSSDQTESFRFSLGTSF